MKALGMLLAVVGLLWLLVAFNKETTVTMPSETIGSGESAIFIPSQTVHNIGLIEDRRNHLMIAGLMTIVGVLLIGFGMRSQPEQTDAEDLKACPFCAEPIRPAALKCRFCQADLPDSFRSQPGNPPARAPRRASARLRDAERKEMETLGITYVDGYFHYADYTYDSLSQAMLHAKAAQRA